MINYTAPRLLDQIDLAKVRAKKSGRKQFVFQAMITGDLVITSIRPIVGLLATVSPDGHVIRTTASWDDEWMVKE